MKLDFQLEAQQRQVMSQTRIQALEVLAMDNVELSAFLKKEYLENPILEHKKSSDKAAEYEDFGDWYRRQSYFNTWSKESRGATTQEFQREFTERGSDLKEYLIGQLNIHWYSGTRKTITDFLIDCLSDEGFLEESAEEVAASLQVKPQEVEECLLELSLLEPYGIFAKDLPSCLLRQLEVMDVEDQTLTDIIQNYMEEVLNGKIGNISRALHISTADVRKYISIIGSLDPKPLSSFGGEQTHYIVPDLILETDHDEWTVRINDNWVGNYALNDYYLKMMQETKDEEILQYFYQKVERARFIINSIEERRKTIVSVGNLIVKRQKEYLEGRGSLKPITMEEAAGELGIHVSTVSRCVKNKYLQCQRGTIPLKRLFAKSISNKQDNAHDKTADEVKKYIKILIDQENKQKPYSDQVLANLLIEKNIHISRRTIAKYREDMGIKGNYDRKSR